MEARAFICLFSAEAVHSFVPVGFPGAQDGLRIFRTVDAVREGLRFQTEAAAAGIANAALAVRGAVEEIAGIKLYAGLRSFAGQRDAALRAARRSGAL